MFLRYKNPIRGHINKIYSNFKLSNPYPFRKIYKRKIRKGLPGNGIAQDLVGDRSGDTLGQTQK
jgi:hypothetical protein